MSDGRVLTVSLRSTDAKGVSYQSIPVTMMCAGFPNPPDPPILILGNRDIISVAWNQPTIDGGSPVLGFFLFMKSSSSESYTLVQNGGEDPTLLSF